MKDSCTKEFAYKLATFQRRGIKWTLACMQFKVSANRQISIERHTMLFQCVIEDHLRMRADSSIIGHESSLGREYWKRNEAIGLE